MGEEKPRQYFMEHLRCFEEFCSLLESQAEKVEVPYEEEPMPGYLLLPDTSGGPFATVMPV